METSGLLLLAQETEKGGLHGAGLSFAACCISSYRTILSYSRTQTKPIAEYPTDVIDVR
jgi:hypothetical protein